VICLKSLSIVDILGFVRGNTLSKQTAIKELAVTTSHQHTAKKRIG